MIVNITSDKIYFGFLVIFWIMYILFIFISNRKYKKEQNMENMEKRAIFITLLGAAAFNATNFFINRGKIIGAKATVQLLLAVSLIIFLIGISILIYLFVKKLRGE